MNNVYEAPSPASLNESTDYSQFEQKWRDRFEFFDKYGPPNTAAHAGAIKALSYGPRLKIRINWFAFFFTWIYFLILGMWRKAITLAVITIAIQVVLLLLHLSGAGAGLLYLWAMCANYNYYLKEVKNENGWNPFVGVRWV